MQYHAEAIFAPSFGMNPPGIILRGSSALGNRPTGFIAAGTEVHRQFISELREAGDDADARSKVVDSFMPTDY